MNLFIGEGYQLVYIGFYVVTSFLIFEKFNDSAYYYNYLILKTNMLIHVLNTWTALILVFGRVFYFEMIKKIMSFILVYQRYLLWLSNLRLDYWNDSIRSYNNAKNGISLRLTPSQFEQNWKLKYGDQPYVISDFICAELQ